MRILIPLLLITSLAFGQHTLNNNGVITTYETRAEYDAAVAALSPTDKGFITDGVTIAAESHLCNGLIIAIRLEFKKQLRLGNMTQTEVTDVFNRIQGTMVALLMGELRGARMICNQTATGGNFTAQRKTFLLNMIDEEIAKL